MKFMHSTPSVLMARQLAEVAGAPQSAHTHADSSPCPFCRRSVPDDADRCSHCNSFLGEVEDEAPNKSLWLLAIVGLVMAMTFSYNVFR